MTINRVPKESGGVHPSLHLSQTDVVSLQRGTLSGNTLRRQLADILKRE